MPQVKMLHMIKMPLRDKMSQFMGKSAIKHIRTNCYTEMKSQEGLTLLPTGRLNVIVRYRHGGGWSRKINAWHLYTLMVYL
jgi:hypothetical protein